MQLPTTGKIPNLAQLPTDLRDLIQSEQDLIQSEEVLSEVTFDYQNFVISSLQQILLLSGGLRHEDWEFLLSNISYNRREQMTQILKFISADVKYEVSTDMFEISAGLKYYINRSPILSKSVSEDYTKFVVDSFMKILNAGGTILPLHLDFIAKNSVHGFNLCAVVQNPDVLPETLDYLAKSDNRFLDLYIAGNPKVEAQTLHYLATIGNSKVKDAIYENPNAWEITKNFIETSMKND